MSRCKNVTSTTLQFCHVSECSSGSGRLLCQKVSTVSVFPLRWFFSVVEQEYKFCFNNGKKPPQASIKNHFFRNRGSFIECCRFHSAFLMRYVNGNTCEAAITAVQRRHLEQVLRKIMKLFEWHILFEKKKTQCYKLCQTA